MYEMDNKFHVWKHQPDISDIQLSIDSKSSFPWVDTPAIHPTSREIPT